MDHRESNEAHDAPQPVRSYLHQVQVAHDTNIVNKRIKRESKDSKVVFPQNQPSARNGVRVGFPGSLRRTEGSEVDILRGINLSNTL